MAEITTYLQQISSRISPLTSATLTSRRTCTFHSEIDYKLNLNLFKTILNVVLSGNISVG